MVLNVGDPAPDFTLPDQHGQATTLSRQPGPTLVVFIPAAFTPVCHDELRALRDVAQRMRVWAVSCDSMFVLRALDDMEHVGFALLSDFWPHGQVAHAYGAFDEGSGLPRRVSMLVDGRGRIAARWESSPGLGRDPGDYLRAFDALPPS
jgi:peroxiredoxin